MLALLAAVMILVVYTGAIVRTGYLYYECVVERDSEFWILAFCFQTCLVSLLAVVASVLLIVTTITPEDIPVTPDQKGRKLHPLLSDLSVLLALFWGLGALLYANTPLLFIEAFSEVIKACSPFNLNELKAEMRPIRLAMLVVSTSLFVLSVVFPARTEVAKLYVVYAIVPSFAVAGISVFVRRVFKEFQERLSSEVQKHLQRVFKEQFETSMKNAVFFSVLLSLPGLILLLDIADIFNFFEFENVVFQLGASFYIALLFMFSVYEVPTLLFETIKIEDQLALS